MCDASGEFHAPMYIFAGIRRKIEWMYSAFEGAMCAVTDSSYINSQVFLCWFKWFARSLPPVRLQLLVLDGHFAHITLDILYYGIYLLILPAHTSHFLQPLDVAVFQPFNRLYEKEIHIADLTRESFRYAFVPNSIKRGFQEAGIFPLCVEVMLQNMVGNTSTQSSSLRHHAEVLAMFDGIPIRTTC